MFAVAMDAVTMNTRSKISSNAIVSSPESAAASEVFNQFVTAATFKAVLSTYRQLCEILRIKPTNFPNFYPKLKAKLHSWKAASLWSKLDKRASHKCYNRGKACINSRVLIIGAGPCGLRTAIEAQLLGAKVVVVEKRDRFSRNNVLHLWPFVIHDLRSLGAKKFFGKFCAGSIDHISIRQLQLILLKVALILGVEVHENVAFKSLLQPAVDQPFGKVGWHAEVSPSDHPVSQYEFDVLIGADGKRNTLLGFNRKEFRGKLAIAITANFINRHSLEEARVSEISGVAFIFNQKFFQDMKEETGIDLENIVYYKDDTHYFVMTAKKQSLLERGVIVKDYNDTAKLLAPDNVDREALMEYARDAANFSTNYQLPSIDFAVNHYGQADVAMFDFTSMYAAENACRVVERNGYKLLQGLVGDSLLEPFWPTGSGCARGFLSSMDAAWMIRSWASGKMGPLQVLAEREAIYRLLAQTTPENLSKNFNQYTLNPATRYPNLVTHGILPAQLRSLYDTDRVVEDELPDIIQDIPRKRKKREYIIHPDALLQWCKQQVALYDDIKITNMTTSWKNGMALCAILNRYRPDLIDMKSLNAKDVAKNNQLVFDICERELGIPPVMTGQEMEECDIPDKLTMVSYISQIYEAFRGEIPYTVRPMKPLVGEEIQAENQHHPSLSIFSRLSQKLQGRKGYSLERESKEKDKIDSLKRSKTTNALSNKRRSKDKGIAVEADRDDVALKSFKKITDGHNKVSFNSRVRDLEEKMRKDAGLRSHTGSGDSSSEVSSINASKHNKRIHGGNIMLLEKQLKQETAKSPKSNLQMTKIGKISPDDWSKKVEQKTQKHKNNTKIPAGFGSPTSQEIFSSKLKQMNNKLVGVSPPEVTSKFGKIDANIQRINHQLKTGYLDTGDKRVASITEHIGSLKGNEDKIQKCVQPIEPSVTDSANTIGTVGGSEICYFCQKRVYLMERLSAEGLFFHRSCLKCEYCGVSLRLGNYAFDRTALCGGKFYCKSHFRMQKPDIRWQEMMKRKHDFLAGGPDAKEIFSSIAANALAKATAQENSIESKVASNEDLAEEKKAEILMDNSPITSPLPETTINVTLRDQTPERVEYENSLVELSEEELLTSELEEEELTQKNLGVGNDLETSEDEFSDLSTDSESEEEAFAEELERSLNADETRRLAETWQQRYSQDGIFSDKEKESSSSDEGSETEIGSDDTGEDIDSEEEYQCKEDEAGRESKTPVESKEVVVTVPVIDLKNWKEQEDESSSEVETSDITDTDESSEENGTESDSHSESEPDIPALTPQIPTIVIEESPPQEEQDLVWGEASAEANIASDKKSCEDEYDATHTLLEQKEFDNPLMSDEDASLLVNVGDVDQIPSSPSSNERSSNRDALSPVNIFDDVIDGISGEYVEKSMQIEICQEHPIDNTSETLPAFISPDYLKKGTEDIRQAAQEIIQNVVSEAKAIVASSVIEQSDIPEKLASKSEPSSSEDSSVSSPLNVPAHTILVESSDDNSVKQNKSQSSHKSDNLCAVSYKEYGSNLDQQPLISPLEVTPEKGYFRNILMPRAMNDSTPTSSNTSNSSTSVSTPSDQVSPKVEHLLGDVAKFTELIASDESEIECQQNAQLSHTDNISSIDAEQNLNCNNESTDFNLNPFVTIRDKTKKANSKDIFSWDSDNSDLPLPWYVNDLAESSNDELCNTGVYRANVIQCIDVTTNAYENNPSSLPITRNELEKTEEKLQNTEQLNNIPITKSKEGDESTHNENVNKERSSPKSEVQNGIKFQGYSGSFAEKVRPKSLVGDSIYLKSLNINLQKLQFPSLTSSLEKLNINQKSNLLTEPNEGVNVEETVKIQNRDYLSSLDKCNNKLNVDNSKHNSSSVVQFAPSVPLQNTKLHRPSSIEEKKKEFDTLDYKCNSKILSSSLESVHSRINDEAKRASQRKFRKSIHEDIQGVPFADDEKNTSNSESSELSSSFNIPNDLTGYVTPKRGTPHIREHCTAELEKARKEARERARLKSDEELGLSPNNYRKKYHKHPSLTSIQYEELLRDDILDDDDDDDDDDEDEDYLNDALSVDNETFLKKANELIPSSSPIQLNDSNTKISPMSSENGTSSRQSQSSSLQTSALSPICDTISSDKNTLTTASSASKTDAANYLESSLSINENELGLSPTVVSSTETSPEILNTNSSSDRSKEASKQKFYHSPEEDKKSSAKKSLLSLLSFAKNGNGKEKNKMKSKENHSKEQLILSNEFLHKTTPKLKSFPHLKLPRSKEKNREKQRKKYLSLEKTGSDHYPVENSIVPIESICEPQDKINRIESMKKSLEKLTLSKATCSYHPVTSLKVENGAAPKASEDSFSDTEEDTQGSRAQSAYSTMERKEKTVEEKEKKALRVAQRVQRQQELKRLRTAQELHRNLQELEVKQRELERQGVEVEKALRGESEGGMNRSGSETELMQEWFNLVHAKNKLAQKEQELLIRTKDLELEERHSKLQQEMRIRMMQTDLQKSKSDIEEEGRILAEMLEIVEKRDELVSMIDQLRIREEEEERELESKMLAKGLQFSPTDKT